MENNHIPGQWTTEGFMQRFEELLPESENYIKAYQRAEEEHYTRFGQTRFKSYDAFRMSRKRLLEKK